MNRIYNRAEDKNCANIIVSDNDTGMLYPIGLGVYTDGETGVETTMLMVVVPGSTEGSAKFVTLNSVADT